MSNLLKYQLFCVCVLLLPRSHRTLSRLADAQPGRQDRAAFPRRIARAARCRIAHLYRVDVGGGRVCVSAGARQLCVCARRGSAHGAQLSAGGWVEWVNEWVGWPVGAFPDGDYEWRVA
jgi:hypothetical protein